MAEILELVDNIGMPFPIVPAPPGQEGSTNLHHAFYQRNHYINGTEGIRAVRFSRTQKVNVDRHNKFHTFFPDGIALSPNEDDEFRLIVTGLAGYVPRQGIEVGGAEPEIVDLTVEQRERLREPGIFKTEVGALKLKTISSFLINYSANHGLSEVSESLIDEFLNTPDEAVRRQNALKIIYETAKVAAEPIGEVYEELRCSRSLRRHAPMKPENVVRNHVRRKKNGIVELLNKSVTALVD